MKKLKILLIAIFLIATSCERSNDTVPDPAGTITTNISNGTSTTLYYGPNSEIASGYSTVEIVFNMQIPSGNICFYTNVLSDRTGNFFQMGPYGGEAVDMGIVNGLGNVIDKPTTGYSAYAALFPGHGYVLRWRKSQVYSTSTQPYFYSRMYVQEYNIGTTGGIIGLVVKLQGPF